MVRLNRLLFTVIFLPLIVLTSLPLMASQAELEKQLAAIDKIEDAHQALVKVNELLTSSTLSEKQEITVLNKQATLYFRLRDFDQALAITEQVQTIAQRNGWFKAAARASKMLGVFQYYQGKYPQALSAYQAALALYQQLNEELEQANLYNNIGLVYSVRGDALKAIDNYQQAELIYERVGTEQDLVDIRYNIAGLYLRLRRYDVAIDMFKEVIAKRIEFNDEAGLASVHSDIGVSYKQSGNYQSALHYLLQALNYFRTAQDAYHLASTYHNLAEVYNELGQSGSAQQYAELAISISKEKHYESILSGSLQSLARALFVQGETQRPLALLEQSTEIAKKSGYQQQLRSNLSLLPLVYSALGDRQQALTQYQAYIDLNFKLSNDQLNEYLAKFESKALKQQVAQLQQNKKLQQLEIEQASLRRNFIIGAAFLILLLGFFIYRRRIDHRLKDELAIQVKQRTTELENLTEELKKANNVKSQFLANMSHEIRTPLTAIIGQAEAIICGEVETKYREKEVEIIHGNSLYLLELINNILDLSKIEANKLELELQEQDLHQILRELANIFTEQARRKGLKFAITHRLPAPFMLKVDGLRLKQILVNLCSNAIKFTVRGEVIVNIFVQDDELHFCVTDTGIGLSYSQIQQVFESFTQGDSSISRRFGGSGLGLCLSDQLAKLMDGRIEIQSELNQGSCFSLIIPFSQSAQYAEVESVSVVQVNADAPKTYHFSGKVLLADDHDDNRLLIARFLRSLGLEVVGACNGQEAIEQYFEHKPAIILLDIQMPEMDGIEAFNILRQKGCDVPIIALTANAMAHEVEHYIELGFAEHLKKPIERKQFISVLAKYFDANICLNNANDALKKVDMSDLVQQFKSNLVLEQQDIILHLKNDDFQRLQALVHRIAGAAQMFGFALLSEHAIKLEQAIKANSFGHINELCQELLNEIDQVLW